MDYICRNRERAGSCYHEFIPGEWDGKTFWDDDSLCMHDEIFDDYPEFLGIWLEAMPGFEAFGINRMERRQWEALREAARAMGGDCAEFVREMEPWMENAFRKAAFITILGI